jgi:hypothetical protein
LRAGKVRGQTFLRNARIDPICFSPYLYRAQLDRTVLQQDQAVPSRPDKLAASYLAFVELESIRIWLRANESTP